jgi:glycosyltransferase involved in cell wall biosynthesis
MRIAIYAIALNEIKHVSRFLETCAAADEIIVCDTGSTDGTVEALRAGGATVHSISIKPWRFDVARNVSLALLPPDLDVCIALDLDEMLVSGWRDEIEARWVPGVTTRGHYLYAFSHLPDGSPDNEFWQDKVHARYGYTWRHACHEAVFPDLRIVEKHLTIRHFRIDQWPDHAKSRSQYLPLLEFCVQEDPFNARDAFTLGREYFFAGKYELAELELRRYFALPRGNWPEQRITAQTILARCRDHAGDVAEALRFYRAATEPAPKTRHPWVTLATALYRYGQWQECYDVACQALTFSDKPSSNADNRKSARVDPHDLAAIAGWHIGKHAAALRHAEAALEGDPHNARLAYNVRLMGRAVDALDVSGQGAREPETILLS